ncbi:hypothetical protein [Streptomyces megasporus]|uniref:hypothetical protein n=1 Tax=Streptomyces megasporus TaxID=44060 RepID=UPI0012FF27A8|nr:hypothetical protein [Streptomyces megasporus]
MPVSPATPEMRRRPKRTRSKRVNACPPLALSSLPLQEINLRTGEQLTLVCPDCRTWCPVTGLNTPKLVPHDTLAGRRCPRGSNRRVEVDLTAQEWGRRLMDAARDAASRRPGRQFHKPIPAPATPVHRMDPPPPTAETARRIYFAHRTGCAACTGRAHCPSGRRLAAAYVELLQQEPRQRRIRVLADEILREDERRRARQAPRRRARQWAEVLPSVQDVDARRTAAAQDAVPPIDGPDLPLEPTRVTT